jgi:hypothetical protein
MHKYFYEKQGFAFFFLRGKKDIFQTSEIETQNFAYFYRQIFKTPFDKTINKIGWLWILGAIISYQVSFKYHPKFKFLHADLDILNYVIWQNKHAWISSQNDSHSLFKYGLFLVSNIEIYVIFILKLYVPIYLYV